MKEKEIHRVRKPTAEEYKQLKQYFMSIGHDEETAEHTTQNYWFAVFECYISDSPAYVGKMIMAVYGMPEFYEVFIEEEGKLKQISQDTGMRFVYTTMKKIKYSDLTPEQKKHYDNCPYVETCEFCNLVIP